MVSTRASRATKPPSPPDAGLSQPPKRSRKRTAPAEEVIEEVETPVVPTTRVKATARPKKGVKFADETEDVKPITSQPTAARRNTRRLEEESHDPEPAPSKKTVKASASAASKAASKPATRGTRASAARSTRRTITNDEPAPELEPEEDQQEEAIVEKKLAPAKRTRSSRATISTRSEEAAETITKKATRAIDRRKETEKAAPVTRKRTRSAVEDTPSVAEVDTGDSVEPPKKRGRPKKAMFEQVIQEVEPEAPKVKMTRAKASKGSIQPKPTENISIVESNEELPRAAERDELARPTTPEDPIFSRPTKDIKLDITSFRPHAVSPIKPPAADIESTTLIQALPATNLSKITVPSTPAKSYQEPLQSKTPGVKPTLLQATPWKLPATVSHKNFNFVGPIKDVTAPVLFNALPKKPAGQSSVLAASPRKDNSSASILRMPPSSPKKFVAEHGGPRARSILASSLHLSPRKIGAGSSTRTWGSQQNTIMAPTKVSALASSPRKVKLDMALGESLTAKPFASSLLATPLRLPKAVSASARTNLITAAKPYSDTPKQALPTFQTSPSVSGEDVDLTMQLDDPTFSCIIRSPAKVQEEMTQLPEVSPVKTKFENIIEESTTIAPADIEGSATDQSLEDLDSVIESQQMTESQGPQIDGRNIANDLIGSEAIAIPTTDADDAAKDDELALSDFVFTTPRPTSRNITDYTEYNKRQSTATKSRTAAAAESSEDEISPSKLRSERKMIDEADETLNFPETPVVAHRRQVETITPGYAHSVDFSPTPVFQRINPQGESHTAFDDTLHFPQTPSTQQPGRVSEALFDKTLHLPQTARAGQSGKKPHQDLDETLHFPATPTPRATEKNSRVDIDETLCFPRSPAVPKSTKSSGIELEHTLCCPQSPVLPKSDKKVDVGTDETLCFPETPILQTPAVSRSTKKSFNDMDETLCFPNSPSVLLTPKKPVTPAPSTSNRAMSLVQKQMAKTTPLPASVAGTVRANSSQNAASPFLSATPIASAGRISIGLTESPFLQRLKSQLDIPAPHSLPEVFALEATSHLIMSPIKSSLRSPEKARLESPKKTVSWDRMAPAADQVADALVTTPQNKQMAVFTGMTFFVDVRSATGQDSADLFVPLLEYMGAQCVQFWGAASFPKVTHVLFKDGDNSTLQKVKASEEKVKCVNIGYPLE